LVVIRWVVNCGPAWFAAATESTTAEFWVALEIDRISLILLVGAGRFERPTPCAQGTMRFFRQTLENNTHIFNGIPEAKLKQVGLRWNLRS
jgi:hypothetical protein